MSPSQVREMPEFQTLVKFLKALAEASRLRIVGLLASHERTVDELASLLALRAPTVSHHLALLRDAGLVSARSVGTARHYQLDAEGLGRIGRLLARPRDLPVPGAAPSDDDWKRKVLRDFVSGERLQEIPASHKKRRVILEWLVRAFKHGRRYTERQVNDLLRRHHPDVATLRRELIAGRWMSRESGAYWRIDAPTEPA